MPPTRLVDVAARAGVSMKTVSNVVNGKASVNEAMRARVMAAIEELGYRPNMAARRLVTGRTGLIAVALPAINVPYFAELAQQLELAARQHGYRLLIESLGGDPEHEWELLTQREHGVVDGVICQPLAATQEQLGQLHIDTPMVILGEHLGPIDIDHVMIDNVAAAREATELLLDHGRHRIAFVGHESAQPSPTTTQRIQGYREALAAAGHDHDELIITTKRYSATAAEAAVTAAWTAGAPFDALLCRDDMMALGSMRALRTLGVAIPRDVAVIGWDDIAPGRVTYPSVTTVSPDKVAIARAALAMLGERIDGFAGTARRILAPYRLIVREST